jgi:mono/diheme cytochrome c family protein
MNRVMALLVVAAVGAAGCGGDGDEGARRTDERIARQTASGKEIFLDAGCGGCHTLKAAGSKGRVGPNLDEHMKHHGASLEHVVETVSEGGNGMPPFEDRLSEDEIRLVARFVVRASENGG